MRVGPGLGRSHLNSAVELGFFGSTCETAFSATGNFAISKFRVIVQLEGLTSPFLGILLAYCLPARACLFAWFDSAYTNEFLFPLAVSGHSPFTDVVDPTMQL